MWSSDNVNNYVDIFWWLLYRPKDQVAKSRATSKQKVNDAPTTSSLIKITSAIPVPHTPPPFFALIIGINQYKSQETLNLKGCVADADSIQHYLEDALKVEKFRIRNLQDAQATRDNILSELKALETTPHINPGEPILIYYAGHGGEATPPPGWEAGGADSKIQMLIPHDYDGQIVQGIPDHTISVLLERIARAKGDNITVIFDCCHSASGTRAEKIDSHSSVRGFEIKHPISPGLDSKLLGLERGARIRPGFLHKGLRSHVLLAACSAKETAKENGGRGAFTKALLQTLSTVSAETITYCDLFERMYALPEQHPQCEGVNQRRILFNAKAPSTGRVLYRIHKEHTKYTLDAGSAHGISNGAEFTIYQEPDQKTSPVGKLIVVEDKNIGPFTTTLSLPDGISEVALTGTGYALQTKAGEGEELRLNVEANHTLDPILEKFLSHTDPARWQVSLVEKEKAELAISLDGDKVVFDILNPQVTQFGLTRYPFALEPTYDAVFPVIRAAAHYHWHLRRTNTKRVLQNHITLDFRKVEELDHGDELNPIQPVGENLNVNGIIELVIDPNSEDDYGIKIINNSPLDLYPSLFFFDNSTLSITSYYQPPTALKNLDVPLSKKTANGPGSLTIGYGSGGEVPYNYFMRDGQDIDVGFLKLFLTTQPVDYSNIPQSSPFEVGDRATAPRKEKPRLIWDTILVQVVQRRAPGA